ncbi:MAG: cellulase family glycosylhydrolase [Isosphaeraceae bacterium]
MVTGAAWNRDIPSGGSVTFGFNASPGNVTGSPSNWVLNGRPLDGSTPTPPSIAIDDGSVVEGNPATGVQSGFFTTLGNQIVDSAGQSVRIAGVNWFGFETSNFAPHGLWARGYREMMDQMKQLGFNTIRLPYSNQLFDAGSTPNGIDFTKNPDLRGLNGLQIMDRIVDYAGQIGLRILLDHHRSTAGNSAQESGLWYTPSYPESRWISDWVMLAQRYQGNSTVIGADLHNEPHGPATWGSGDNATDWRLAAERAGNAVLAANPSWLIVVEGIERVGNDNYWWGGNLAAAGQYPVRLNVANRLVYSPHDYPQSVYNQPWFSAPNYPANLPGVWDQHWGYLYRQNTVPILLGEFGSKLATTSDRQWADAMIAYLKGDLDGNGSIDIPAGKQGPSWTWWSWNPNSGDTGGILQDDWTSVNTNKVALLQPVEFPLSGGGSTARSAVFTVSLSAASSTPVTVAFTTVAGTATAGVDFQSQSGTLTFAPGETRKTIAIAIVPDTTNERDETFTVRLSSPVGGTLARADGRGTITNDDGPPPPTPPSISISPASTSEGNSGTRPLDFVVRLSEAASSPVTVGFGTSNGTAAAPGDFTAATGTLTFAPGETQKVVSISIVGDTVVEADEVFNVVLTNPVNATLGTASAVGTILNDDTAPPPTTSPVVYKVRDDWGSGFVADVTLTNTGTTAWTDWTISFDLPATITNIWNAVIVSRVGNRYTIRAASWNRSLAPGSSLTFGFQGSSTSTPKSLANVVLNGVPV